MTPETALKNQVKDYLNIKGYFWWYNLAGVGAYKGIPDIFVAGPRGLYPIEFKRPKGKLSEHQENFKAKIENFPWVQWITCRSLEDVSCHL